jgi:Fe-S cluster assembly iron-binding protein IscA
VEQQEEYEMIQMTDAAKKRLNDYLVQQQASSAFRVYLEHG